MNLNHDDIEAQITVTNPDGSIYEQSIWAAYGTIVEAAIVCADMYSSKIVTVQVRVKS